LKLAWAKKVSKTTISTNKLKVVAGACHPSYAGGINRRIMVQASPRQKCETLFKKQLTQKELEACHKW
jgi:hypothetical protein